MSKFLLISTKFALLSIVVHIFGAFAESKMTEVLSQSKLPKACQAKLIRIADDVIGPKKHRILERPVTQASSFTAFVLLSYNDQNSHLNFTVTQVGADCQISMNESYELPATCPDARQSIFKRWVMLGRLDDDTIVMRYDKPRNKAELIADEKARAVGYLTQTRRGKACLITKQQDNMPMPPEIKDE